MRFPRTIPPRLALLASALSLLALIVLAGCGDDNKKTPTAPGGGTPTTSSFTGILVNGGAENGTITITIQSTSLARSWSGTVVMATGTLKPVGGSAVALTGTYDSDLDSLYLSGGSYTLAGEYDDNPSGDAFKSISGAYSGPSGDGLFGAILGGSAQVHVFLGDFENSGMTVSGHWNIVAVDTLVGGIALQSGGTIDDVLTMLGTVTTTGTSRPITLMGGGGTVSVTATGTWNTVTDSVTGTWNSDDSGSMTSDDGTWAGKMVTAP